MMAVDTNVVVRLVTADDSAQFPLADQLFQENHIFVGLAVLVETDWVLRTTYGFSRAAASTAMAGVCGLPQVTVESADIVERALDAHQVGLSVADAVHVLVAETMRATHFATFDEYLHKRGKNIARSISVIAP